MAAGLGGSCAPAKRPAALRTASSPPGGRHRRFLCNLAASVAAHEMDGALSGLAHYCNSQQCIVIGQQRPGTPTSNPPSEHFPTLAQPVPLRCPGAANGSDVWLDRIHSMATALAQAAAAAAAVTPCSSRRLQHRAAPFTSSWRPSARRPAFQQLLRASASGDEQPQQPGQPPAADEEQQAGGAALGPRDDDVLPDSLTGALEDASRATVEALERGVDRCVVSSGRGGCVGEHGL